MKPSFIITGDSWSQGEWDGYPTDYRITHGGVHQYLVEAGYAVKNVGRGGYNNLESLDALKYAVVQEQFSHCVFFFTDPLRQSTYEEFSTQLPSEICKQHVIHVLEQLDSIHTQTKIKIVLIGGCAKVNLYDYKPKGIELIIPSLSEFLVPGFIDSEYMDSCEWTEHWLKLKTNCSGAHKQEILNVYEQAQRKFNLWEQHKELFWPDGLHTNRIGHKLLFDYLARIFSLH